jgi:hypothetical protein
MVVEKANGSAATAAEVDSFMEWLLCTWDPAYRMELVANDIRVDREGVDVELMVVPWYSQTPRDIAVMYATWSYDKQYQELLETAGHLGDRCYAMVKLCDTRFAQSEMKVYINFEKNYRTYRRAWGGSNTKAEEEATTTTTTSTTTPVAAAATSLATATITTTTSTTATTTTTVATVAVSQQEHHEQQLHQEPQRYYLRPWS